MKNYDVILIQPDTISPYATLFPPYGPLFLAPKLTKEGYEVLIFDARVDKESKLIKVIKNSTPVNIGFSLFTGPMILKALNLAKKIREITPEVPLIWGGPHPTLLPEQTIQHPLVDIVVRGEGDNALPEITNALKKNQTLKRVNGITYKENGKIVSTPDRDFVLDWDREVSQAWDLVDIDNYIYNVDGHKALPVITSRGCPYRCKFCWNLVCNKRMWRGWSVDHACNEIKKFIDVGIDYITLQDDSLGNNKRVMEMANYFKKEGVIWAIENGMRIGNHLTAELFNTLKDTSCQHISFGSESGSQRLLDYINKGITIDQIIHSAKITAKYELGGKYSWMIGLPDETIKDISATLKMIDKIKEINPNTSHYISIFAPCPGTEIFKRAVKLGWRPPEKFEDWGAFREEATYPYIKDIWYLRSIYYSNFFRHALDAKNRSFSKSKLMYLPGFIFLKKTANYRWQKKAFGFPIEYKAAHSLYKVIKKIKLTYGGK